jgi:6-phosphofructokinase 1
MPVPKAAAVEGTASFSSSSSSSSSTSTLLPTISAEFACPRLTDTFALEPHPSPFAEGGEYYSYGLGQKFVDDADCVLLNALRYEALESSDDDVMGHDRDTSHAISATADGGRVHGGDGGNWSGKWAMRAGPRERIFFKPEGVKAAIVTCGGLCPGLNDVIRQLVITLDEYGVKDIRGIRYGFRGFFEQEGELRAPVQLTPDMVETIHLVGRGKGAWARRAGTLPSRRSIPSVTPVMRVNTHQRGNA